MIKGLIFDLDGTLVRLPIRYNLIQENLKTFFQTKEEFKPLIPSIIDKSSGNSLKIKNAFQSLCKEETLAAKNLEIMSDAKNILEYFKSKNYLLGLITMQCKKAAKIAISKLDLPENFFLNIISRDESYDRLEQIQKTIQIFNLNPNEILVVGDRIYDIESAKKAGCHCILSNSEKIGKYNGCRIISTLSELREINF